MKWLQPKCKLWNIPAKHRRHLHQSDKESLVMTNTSLGTRRDTDTEDHVLSLRVVETVLPELRVEEGCQRGSEAQGDVEAAITGLSQSILKSKPPFLVPPTAQMLSIWTELWIKKTIEDRVLKANHGKCVSSSLASALRTGRLMLSGRQRELCASKLPGEFEVGILRVQGKCLTQESHKQLNQVFPQGKQQAGSVFPKKATLPRSYSPPYLPNFIVSLSTPTNKTNIKRQIKKPMFTKNPEFILYVI